MFFAAGVRSPTWTRSCATGGARAATKVAHFSRRCWRTTADEKSRRVESRDLAAYAARAPSPRLAAAAHDAAGRAGVARLSLRSDARQRDRVPRLQPFRRQQSAGSISQERMDRLRELRNTGRRPG